MVKIAPNSIVSSIFFPPSLWTWLSLLLNLFPLCHLSLSFSPGHLSFFLPRLGLSLSLSLCCHFFSSAIAPSSFFLFPWCTSFCHCMLHFSITLSFLLLLFPLYWTFLPCVVALSPFTIILSPLTLFFFYAIDLSFSMVFSPLPSLSSLCRHSLPLGSFSPLCHHSLPLDFFFLLCRHFLPSTIVFFFFPWLFPLYHHVFPFAITPSPWALSLPCVVILSPLPLLFLCHCFLSLHCSFPFPIVRLHLPLFSPLCHHNL